MAANNSALTKATLPTISSPTTLLRMSNCLRRTP
jgi:hypothetical protein